MPKRRRASSHPGCHSCLCMSKPFCTLQWGAYFLVIAGCTSTAVRPTPPPDGSAGPYPEDSSSPPAADSSIPPQDSSSPPGEDSSSEGTPDGASIPADAYGAPDVLNADAGVDSSSSACAPVPSAYLPASASPAIGTVSARDLSAEICPNGVSAYVETAGALYDTSPFSSP